jgi:lipoprotein-anchoring transpeptidase ErfK/SrfK
MLKRGLARYIVLAALAGSAIPGFAQGREVVPFPGAAPGTIVVKTQERQLYLVRGDGMAWRYRVAVGRPGKQWFGEAQVDGKYVKPAWSPPAEVRRDNPRLPEVIPGGAPNNPMGVRALTLNRDEYAIHGTNRPDSIGTFASYGCIRMLNEDIVDLFEKVEVGARVVVTR